ncbi:hypothetical protein PIB30_103797, partial [Stylosanthes scabra]|nr:hypothetical protein [Stylosanthes scabra]
MLEAYNHNYFDPEIERPYSIRKLTENDNNEGLHYIDRDKMRRARYSNVIDQILVYAGGETMFPGPITRHVGSHSLLPKYVSVPKQPNEFDCGVYVLKYMEIVNPNDLAKRNFKIPVWSK